MPVTRLRTTVSALALAATFAVAGAASAQTPIYSGGASLPATLARALLDCLGQPVEPRVAACDSPSNLPYLYLYASLGSGAGTAAFTENQPVGFNASFPTPAVPPEYEVNGSSPAFRYAEGAGGYGDHHFSLSEATLSDGSVDPAANQLLDYRQDQDGAGPDVNTQALNGAAIQVPFVGTGIAIGFNTTQLQLRNTAPDDGTSGMRLDREQYCAIWGGYVTNWNDPLFARTNRNRPYASGNVPIIRVVRADSSGTTFIFTNRMFEQCRNLPGEDNNLSVPGVQASGFPYPWPYAAGTGGSITFWNPRAGFTPPAGQTPDQSPIQFGPQNNGVASIVSGALTDNDGDPATAPVPVDVNGSGRANYPDGVGRVGYASPGFVEPVVDNGVVTANLAANNGNFVAPSSQRVSLGVRNVLPPSNTASPAAWGALQGSGVDGTLEEVEYPTLNNAYPLVGFNYIDAYTCYGSNAKRDAVRAIFSYITTNSTDVQNIIDSFAFVPLNNGLLNSIRRLTLQTGATEIRGPSGSCPGA